MTFTIDEIISKDDEIFNYFATVADDLVCEYKKSNYPVSINCLMGLMGTINSLKLAAFDLVEESETHLYAIKTLLRPAIEHFLRFNYLSYELMRVKNDSVGEEYRKYSRISEHIALVKSKFALESDKKIQNRILNEIRKSVYPSDMSSSEIKRIVSKWSYKNIARKINSTVFEKHEDWNFIKGLVVEYSELSSFVHGGVYAETCYHLAFSRDTLNKESTESIFLFSFLASAVRLHILMIGCHIDPKFNENFSEYRNIMSELLSLKTDIE